MNNGLQKLQEEDQRYFAASDRDADGKLTRSEFSAFQNPEHHEHMHETLVTLTLKEKDKNADGQIDFKEYIGDLSTLLVAIVIFETALRKTKKLVNIQKCPNEKCSCIGDGRKMKKGGLFHRNTLLNDFTDVDLVKNTLIKRTW